jgi:cysteine desulfurase
MRIYLDNAASTKPDDRVLELVSRTAALAYANDSSLHPAGAEAAKCTERARAALAAALGATPEELVFTSGGTEANNLAVLGAAAARETGKDHIIISALEHASVYAPAMRLKASGLAVTEILPGPSGFIEPAAVAAALRPGTLLVSVVQAVGETGALNPVEELGALCRKKDVLFHTDACQSFLKTGLAAGKLDLVTVNSHKIHGVKGAGALYVRRGARLGPLELGGPHENGLRPGTRNTPAIAGFGLAAELYTVGEARKVAELGELLRSELSRLPGARLNGRGTNCLKHIVSLTLDGIPSAAGLLRELGGRGIFASAGSACSAGASEPSRVLLNSGLNREAALRTVRLSLGRFNTAEEVRAAALELAACAAACSRSGHA